MPLRLGGLVPLVLFVAARDVPAGAELTLKYGEAWVSTFLRYFRSASAAAVFAAPAKQEHEVRARAPPFDRALNRSFSRFQWRSVAYPFFFVIFARFCSRPFRCGRSTCSRQ